MRFTFWLSTGSTDGMPDADAGFQQCAVPGIGRAIHRAIAGYRSGPLLHDSGTCRRQRRRLDVHERRRSATCLRLR